MVSSGRQPEPLSANRYEEDLCLCPSHVLFSIVVLVNWTISQPIDVTEGDGVILTVFGAATGIYAKPIEIGVVCAEVIATDVRPGSHHFKHRH